MKCSFFFPNWLSTSRAQSENFKCKFLKHEAKYSNNKMKEEI